MKTRISLSLLMLITVMSVAQQAYEHRPNSWEYPKIPKGVVTQHTWESKIYANTTREYYVYVPAQYDASQPAALMIFQDGHAYVKADGHFRVPTVFDNLISQGKMPVTIGLFINPGHDKDAPTPENPWRVTNRSIEYDEVSDTYGKFLVEEMIPELKKTYNVSDDPNMRAVCGISSGGICAFTAAWFRPNQFHRVLSHIGSFTDIRGGHNYPPMIRKEDKKDIKVLLQDGTHDLDNRFGNWWLANLQMEAALKFKGYEYKFIPGEGAHDGNHGGVVLPESLTWLWKDVVADQIPSGVYPFDRTTYAPIVFAGETTHFSDVTLSVGKLKDGLNQVELMDSDFEQIAIIKSGELTAILGDEKKTLGPSSVVVISPGEKGILERSSEEVSYYLMKYRAKQTQDPSRGGSYWVDMEELEFREHDRGGVRSYFRKSTSMCPYYEMHMTTLKPGIKSHEPHTHGAAEILLMVEGETETEIGNELFQGKAGDLYFMDANVPHSIRNIGDKPCRYIAFQWE